MVWHANEAATYALAIFFLVVCTSVVILRLLSRRLMGLSLGADDWLALSALVFTYGCGVIMIIGAATAAIGGPIPQIPTDEYKTFDNAQNQSSLKLQYAILMLSAATLGLIRLTITFLYRRLFRFSAYEIFLGILTSVIVLWTITFFFVTLLECGSHISANWGSSVDLVRYCKPAIDLVIFIFPIFPTLRLRLDWQRKCLVLLVFVLGVFSVTAGIIRMAVMIPITHLWGEYATEAGGDIVSDSDFIWWTFMEIGVGCLVSNLPPLIGLVRYKAFAPSSSFLDKISRKSSRAKSVHDVPEQSKSAMPEGSSFS